MAFLDPSESTSDHKEVDWYKTADDSDLELWCALASTNGTSIEVIINHCMLTPNTLDKHFIQW
jgi:hypothetical protein